LQNKLHELVSKLVRLIPRRSADRKASCAGFTRAELAAILAVLAIFACLQVPAFSGGKDQSRIAQCSNNLRQFAGALQILGAENNDNLPLDANGYWPWDLNWSVGNTVTQRISFRRLYCPGTSVRFSDQDNLNLWNYSAGSFHVINYAFTLPRLPGVGNLLIATNLNPTLFPQRIYYNGTYMPAPSPAQRVLVADATISQIGQYSYSQRYTYNYTSVPGGYSVPHLSAHLKGMFPAGGNLGMLDGHVEWRKFDDMACRVVTSGTSPGFWW
jgi:prepilin-type processing-associated H-X9-DG protein